jgi:hypothetical protein
MVAEGSQLLAAFRRGIEHFTAVPFLRHGTVPDPIHDNRDKGLLCFVEGASIGWRSLTFHPAAERLT